MNRRSFVAALAAGAVALGGCAGPPGSETPTDDAPTETPTGTGTGTPTGDPGEDDDPVSFDRTSIVDLETAPRTYALSPTWYRDDPVTVTAGFVSTATADGPATVRATVANESEYDDTVRLDWKPPFGRATSDAPHPPGERYGDGTYRAGLVFAPAADNPLVSSPPAVARDDDGLWRASDVTDRTPDPLRLGSGESLTADYYLVGHPDGAGDGRPTGVYEFTGGEEPSVIVAVWDSERPGPDAESRFAGASVPSLPGDAATAWYHEAGPASRSYLRPETERTDLPAAVPFTFVNHGREPTSCGHWGLYKLVDGEWFDLGPYIHTSDCRIIAPGGSKRFVLRAFHGPGLDAWRRGVEMETFDHLGGGRYAVAAGYGADSDRSAALLDVEAPVVEVRQTDDLATERNGDTLVATSPRQEDEDPRVLRAERVDDADRRLIPEQAMARRGVRNTVSFLADDPGLAAVRLRTDRRVADRATRYTDSSYRFRLAGQAYEFTVSSP